MLRSKELEQRGLSREMLRRATDAGRVERVARGLYSLPGNEVSEHHSLVVMASRIPHARVSLLSALRFHDLTTQNPRDIWITVARGVRSPSIEGLPLKVCHCKKSLLERAVERHRIEGVDVPVYSVARTLVDLFVHRNKLGTDVAIEALKAAWEERRFTLKELNVMAEDFRMSRVMKPYLESLLS